MPLISNNKNLVSGFPSLEAEARARAASGDGESWVFIVPNRIAQRRMERDILEAAHGRTLPKLQILTLADLAGALATSAFPDYRLIGDGESAVLIELSIRKLLGEHKLSFFERAASSGGNANDHAFPIPRGTFELVINTIRQLKESGVAPPDIASDLLQSQSKGETTEVRRARDILLIYEAYQAWLIERSFMDTHGQMLLVNVRYADAPKGEKNPVRQDFHTAFSHAVDIFISGFYYLEPPSIALIARLAEMGTVSVTIELEEDKNNPDLFAGLIDLEARLLLNGFHSINRARKEGHPLGDYLGRHLFQARDELIEQQKIPLDDEVPKVQYLTASDAANEVEEIARHIKLLYDSDAEIQQDLSQIVVATPDSEAYTPLFEEIFRRYEIPVQIADRYHLDRSPLVQALLSLLDAARTGLRKRELVRILGSPYFDFEQAIGNSDERSSFDARNLLDVLSRYRNSGDAVAIARTFSAQLQRMESEKNDSEDSREFARAEAEQTRIHRALRDLERIKSLLRSLLGELTPKEFCDAVRSLIASLQTPERILSMSRVTIAAGTLENDTRAYRALVKLIEELEQLFQILGVSNEKLSYFEHRLKAALIVTRYSPRERSRAVLVTSLAQSISHPAKYLFLAGLAEGAFPAPYQPQVFLTSGLQKGERKQLLEDRVLFYQALINFERKLYLSYPKKSAGGAELNRSNFLGALEEVLEIETAPKAEGVFSSNDLYRMAHTLQPSVVDGLGTSYPNASWIRTLKQQVPRSREAMRARLSKEDSIYRGAVDPALLTVEERAALEYNKSRVWSVTQLELYAICPFRFFARDILGLGEQQEMEEGLDAMERGSALHEVLRQFLLFRRERKLPAIQDVSEAELPAIYAEAKQLATNHFQTIASEHPFWRLDSEHLFSGNQPDGSLLWKFIKREHDLAPFELRPRFFEVSFGGAGRAPKTPIDPEISQDAPVNLGGFQLRGKIDRIDTPKQNEDGTAEGDAFAIIDYKSGKQTPPWYEIERGLSLQLPLYLRVAEDLLRSHIPALKGVAALYHKVLGEKSERKLGIALRSYTNKAFEVLGNKRTGGLLDSEEELAELIEQAVTKAKTYVDGVAAGQFPLLEANLIEHCKHCPYGSVCRVHEAEQAGVLR